MQGSTRREVAWMFRFALSATRERQVSYARAEQLFENIIEWVEQRDLQVGGGFSAEKRADTDPPRPLQHRRWLFRFGLESSGEVDVAETAAAELFSDVRTWAPRRGLTIDGGLRGESEVSAELAPV